jgi:CRP-like cAMP-binding protein/FixJ family two-component response regulator
MKVLLADDSAGMRAMFRRALERLGHLGRDILEVQSGPEVESALLDAAYPIDLIIFDWDLPGMDGLALMSRLKALGLGETVSVLLSVNRQQRGLLPKAFALGPCDSIDRPFTEETCEQKLRSMGKVVEVKQAESSRRLRILPAASEPADTGMPFLVLLPAVVIDDLLKLAEERPHQAGAVLLKAGQMCDSLHIVTRGQVDLISGGKTIRTVGEGDPFGEFSFMMGEPSTYTAQAKTQGITASLSKAGISDLLRKHPGLDKQFTSLMERYHEVLSARAATIAKSDFKGSFDTMSFANVLQVLNIGKKSGVLTMRLGEQSGGLYLENGEVVHAWTDHSTGELAFYMLSGWKKATFGFSSSRRVTERTLRASTMTMLMEAMRRLEEKPGGSVAPQDEGLDQLFPSG